ncbi:MAG TPA: transposase [Pseudoxanthomonas sp.]
MTQHAGPPKADAWGLLLDNDVLDKTAFEANWRARQRLDEPQWARVLAVLPGRIGARASNGGNARRFVEAVLWMAHTRAHWPDIPSEYGAWHAIYIRFGRWAHEDVWEDVVKAMDELPETQVLLGNMVKKYMASHRIQNLRGTMK